MHLAKRNITAGGVEEHKKRLLFCREPTTKDMKYEFDDEVIMKKIGYIFS
ncbi:hypothetical protein G4378_14590 [Dorea longicatena]|nr:hypothetical protein [Dorea longicatena]NSC57330.1 hypothetical protein [Dorea longicatena]NSD09682.1 hypothetical protein [Dorea longicatena]NSF13092.1 hypothetical protein [Dorea longicatena]